MGLVWGWLLGGVELRSPVRGALTGAAGTLLLAAEAAALARLGVAAVSIVAVAAGLAAHAGWRRLARSRGSWPSREADLHA